MASPDVTLTHARSEEIHHIRGPANEITDKYSGLDSRFYHGVPRFNNPPPLNFRTSFKKLLTDTIKLSLIAVKLTPFGIPEPRYTIHRKLPGENGWSAAVATNILQKAADNRILFLDVLVDPDNRNVPEDWYNHRNRKDYIRFVVFGFKTDEIYVEILGERKLVSPTLRYLIRNHHFVKLASQSYGAFRGLWKDLCGNVAARSFLTMEEVVKFNNHRLPVVRRDLEALAVCLFGRGIFPYESKSDLKRRYPIEIYSEKNVKVEIHREEENLSQAEEKLRRRSVIFKTSSAHFDVFVCNYFTVLFSIFYCQCEVYLHSTRGKNWLEGKEIHSLGHLLIEIANKMFAHVSSEGTFCQPMIGRYEINPKFRGTVDFGVNRERDESVNYDLESAEPLFSSRESSLIGGVIKRNTPRTSRRNVNYEESSSNESGELTFLKDMKESMEEISEQICQEEAEKLYESDEKFLRTPKKSN